MCSTTATTGGLPYDVSASYLESTLSNMTNNTNVLVRRGPMDEQNGFVWEIRMLGVETTSTGGRKWHTITALSHSLTNCVNPSVHHTAIRGGMNRLDGFVSLTLPASLSSGPLSRGPLPIGATGLEIAQSLSPVVDRVSVETVDAQANVEWRVTFHPSAGNVPLLAVDTSGVTSTEAGATVVAVTVPCLPAEGRGVQ